MRKHRIPSRLFTLLVYIFLYAPIVLLIVFSFNATKSNRVWGGFSLDWYVELFHNTRLLGALRTTIILSVLAAFIATILGTAAAIGFYSMRRRSRSICLSVNNIPLTNADIITGVSMMLLFVFAIGVFNDSFLSDLLGVRWRTGFGTLLIAHITFNAPYVILSVMPRLRQLDPNVYEAAQDLGASGWYAFRKVILPEIMPGVLNGLIIAFTMSIDDFVISYFTKGSGVTTLAVEIYTMVKKPVTPEINALSTLMFLVVFALLLTVNIRQARQETASQRRKAKLNPGR
ncbi:ABC transporter permease [Flavonifractor sp. An82]|uniref:ABC transporter permease n=1 Tax=Flavonifractor sp. An82 TaxID=1965660 RepID=UPI000B398A19|nr:ABC transporter permease [Flavonifractor sp. An82]OUN20787.1 putrescine aminotransferase [Flavonifractor sp. An82]